MNEQIKNSNLFVDLSEEQQQLVSGGIDFELSATNYAQRIAVLEGQTSSGPDGSTANSAAAVAVVNTAAQDFLSLGAGNLPNVTGLGNAPSLGGSVNYGGGLGDK
jgi:hypothetical protein